MFLQIVHRARHCYVILNSFPYTSGHVMIVPFAHLDELSKLPEAAAQEMMALSQKMEHVLRQVYSPDGINLGMNIGRAAGAGVAGHVHMHFLPRWVGDTNFMRAACCRKRWMSPTSAFWARCDSDDALSSEVPLSVK